MRHAAFIETWMELFSVVACSAYKITPNMQAWRRAGARIPRLAGRGLVQIYRYTLSPLIGPRCRHLPSCSEYADEAIVRFGLWAGGWIALARILRCHPFGTDGLDFVPAALPARAHWWMPWRYGHWRGTNEMPPVSLSFRDGPKGRTRNP